MKIDKIKIETGSAVQCQKCGFIHSSTKTEIKIKAGTDQLQFDCKNCKTKNKIKFKATAYLKLEQ